MIIHYSHVSKGRRKNETAIIVHGYNRYEIKKTSRLLLIDGKFQYSKGERISKAVYAKALKDFRIQSFDKPTEENSEAQTILATDPLVMAGAIAHETYHGKRTD